jgi:CheY-like chemotaxis protein
MFSAMYVTNVVPNVIPWMRHFHRTRHEVVEPTFPIISEGVVRVWLPSVAGAPTSRRPVRVLIADDDAETRGMLRELLEGEGVVVVADAADGSEAVRLTVEHSPDVVLIDVRMPEMDGIEAARIITASQSSTRVVVLSSYEDRVLKQAAAQAGASAYVVKGASTEPILEAVLEDPSTDADE